MRWLFLFLFGLTGASSAAEWHSLFDGKSLAGWRVTEFAGRGDVEAKDGVLILGQGMLTGVNLTAPLPQAPYEIELEARKTLGSDFFMGLTFPVGTSLCTWINGGWGGAVVGLSSIDGADASQNSTTQYRKFDRDKWYHFRLQVTLENISAWIDNERIINEDIRGKTISLRSGEIEQSAPFGLAAWNTRAELRGIRWRSLAPETQSEDAVAEALLKNCEALVAAAEKDAGRIHARLAELCDRFGPRLAGSTNHDAAVDWIVSQLKHDGLDAVRTESIMIPRWVRGAESVELISPDGTAESLPILGLGGSIGTPPEGITASVLVVTNFMELTNRAAEARGRIVVFDAPYTEYGETVRYRTSGAIAAAKVGAVASLVRSVGPFSLRTPHTGMMSYDSATPKIPHAALASEDTARLRRWQQRGVTPKLRLRMGAHVEGEVPSRNVLAEIRGREKPDEIIVVGGHSDSWDVGQGAQDDAGGVVATWEVLNLMRQLKLQPRRTIRLVLWTDEEAGGIGAKAYRDSHRPELANHVLAMESDAGTFAPRGFAFTGSDAATAQLKPLARWFGERIAAGEFKRGGSATDVAPLLSEGVPVSAPIIANERYYWYHHSPADTVDKVNPKELARCTGLMAALAWWVADHPDRLPR